MPFDKSGKHHPNTQKAMAADKAPSKPKQESAPPAEAAAPAPTPMAEDVPLDMGDPMMEPDIATCPNCGTQFINEPMPVQGASAPAEMSAPAPALSGM